MSVVRGNKTVKNYDDFRDIVEKIAKRLRKIGIKVPTGWAHYGWDCWSSFNVYKGSYHIEDSTVLFEGYVSCLEEEAKRNYEGSKMFVEIKVIGKDHENVRGYVSNVLKQEGIEIEKARNITKNDDHRLFLKLKEKGI